MRSMKWSAGLKCDGDAAASEVGSASSAAWLVVAEEPPEVPPRALRCDDIEGVRRPTYHFSRPHLLLLKPVEHGWKKGCGPWLPVENC